MNKHKNFEQQRNQEKIYRTNKWQVLSQGRTMKLETADFSKKSWSLVLSKGLQARVQILKLCYFCFLAFELVRFSTATVSLLLKIVLENIFCWIYQKFRERLNNAWLQTMAGVTLTKTDLLVWDSSTHCHAIIVKIYYSTFER